MEWVIVRSAPHAASSACAATAEHHRPSGWHFRTNIPELLRLPMSRKHAQANDTPSCAHGKPVLKARFLELTSTVKKTGIPVGRGGLFFLPSRSLSEGFESLSGHTLGVGESGLSRGDMPLKVAANGHA